MQPKPGPSREARRREKKMPRKKEGNCENSRCPPSVSEKDRRRERKGPKRKRDIQRTEKKNTFNQQTYSPNWKRGREKLLPLKRSVLGVDSAQKSTRKESSEREGTSRGRKSKEREGGKILLLQIKVWCWGGGKNSTDHRGGSHGQQKNLPGSEVTLGSRAKKKVITFKKKKKKGFPP